MLNRAALLCYRAAILLLAFVRFTAAAPLPPVNDFNALKPAGDAPRDIILTRPREPSPLERGLASRGSYPFLITDYDIVLPAQPNSQEQKAAAELERWLEEITGVPFAIVCDVPKPGRKGIHIGLTKGFRESGLSDPRRSLGDEGYSIQFKDDHLFLTGGRRRGPINAVFALLEEDLGCRWYSNNVNVIPRRPELTFRPVPRSFSPRLEGREPFYWESLEPLWSLRNRTNSTQVPIPDEWGGHTFWALRTHSHTLLVPPEKYFNDHPEYYGLKHHSTQREPKLLCLTNPNIVPIVADSVRAILKQSPAASAIMIAKEDGFLHGCFCPRCTALAEAEGTPQAAELLLVNAVAQKLESEFPHVLFCGYAYTYTLKAPRTIHPRKNVGIRLCNNDAHPNPFTSVADHAGFQQTLREWQAICSNLFIYDYWQNPSYPHAPMPNMEMIASNIRWLADHNVREISGLGTATWYRSGDRTEMRAWVFAKLLWNPQWDVHALMRDFNQHFYGQAAPAMNQYDDLLAAALVRHAREMQQPEGGRRFPMTAPLYADPFLAQATALLDQAAQQAENDAIRQRIQLVRRTVDFVRKSREKSP